MSFIPNAFAEGTAAAASSGPFSGLMQFAPMIVIFALFWLLLIRPQQKKMKVHNQMLASLGNGEKVITNGGIIGRIVKVSDDGFMDVEIANNVIVKMQRSAIAGKFEEAAATTEKTDVAK